MYSFITCGIANVHLAAESFSVGKVAEDDGFFSQGCYYVNRRTIFFKFVEWRLPPCLPKREGVVATSKKVKKKRKKLRVGNGFM